MVIIGAGRVGGELAARAEARGLSCTLVTRTTGDEALTGPGGAPILVLVRNDDLDAVLARVPAARHADLVFVQNGALEADFAARGLEGATRGLLYFAVAKRGGPLVPGLVSPFAGPHAETVAAWFRGLGIDAEAMGWDRFRGFALEKLMWLVVHGILCEAYEGITVGALVDSHRVALDALVAELAPVGARAYRVEVEPADLAERLVAYSRTIPDWGSSVKEWAWRNGWFVARAREQGVPTPLHDGLIALLGLPR